MKTAFKITTALVLLGTAFLALPQMSQANEASYTITLNGGKFEPAELAVPADQKIKIIVKNATDAPMEFESHSLNREKVISAQAEASVLIGPLKAGTYEYFDEFSKTDAKGTIKAK